MRLTAEAVVPVPMRSPDSHSVDATDSRHLLDAMRRTSRTHPTHSDTTRITPMPTDMPRTVHTRPITHRTPICSRRTRASTRPLTTTNARWSTLDSTATRHQIAREALIHHLHLNPADLLLMHRLLPAQHDDFIQAQQQLARWASEDVVSVVVLDQPPSGTMSDSQPYIDVGPISGAIAQQQHPHQQQHQQQHPHQHHGDHHQSSAAAAGSGSGAAAAAATSVANSSIMALPIVPNGISVSQRDYYPSPPSTETESSGSVIQPPIRRGLQSAADTAALSQHQQQLQLLQLPIYQQHPHQHHHPQQSGDTSSSNNSQSEQIIENGCYPEYKH
ncbi:GM22504 [Drosophila sechellia]|uniref:GM22504 n=1 Tax=Drosophila sechellia TaxID=7238 RepID=B4IKH1_DROSE|nr:GM22504 [Drosophila sechellia]